MCVQLLGWAGVNVKCLLQTFFNFMRQDLSPNLEIDKLNDQQAPGSFLSLPPQP